MIESCKEICCVCDRTAHEGWACESCNKSVCGNSSCTVSYTQFNQVDYTLCTNCGDYQENERSEEAAREYGMGQKEKKKQELLREEIEFTKRIAHLDPIDQAFAKITRDLRIRP